MDGMDGYFGLACIAWALYFGLGKVADAIKYWADKESSK